MTWEQIQKTYSKEKKEKLLRKAKAAGFNSLKEVYDFQVKHKLKAIDGDVGPETKSKLKEVKNLSLNSTDKMLLNKARAARSKSKSTSPAQKMTAPPKRKHEEVAVSTAVRKNTPLGTIDTGLTSKQSEEFTKRQAEERKQWQEAKAEAARKLVSGELPFEQVMNNVDSQNFSLNDYSDYTNNILNYLTGIYGKEAAQEYINEHNNELLKQFNSKKINPNNLKTRQEKGILGKFLDFMRVSNPLQWIFNYDNAMATVAEMSPATHIGMKKLQGYLGLPEINAEGNMTDSNARIGSDIAYDLATHSPARLREVAYLGSTSPETRERLLNLANEIERSGNLYEYLKTAEGNTVLLPGNFRVYARNNTNNGYTRDEYANFNGDNALGYMLSTPLGQYESTYGTAPYRFTLNPETGELNVITSDRYDFDKSGGGDTGSNLNQARGAAGNDKDLGENSVAWNTRNPLYSITKEEFDANDAAAYRSRISRGMSDDDFYGIRPESSPTWDAANELFGFMFGNYINNKNK